MNKERIIQNYKKGLLSPKRYNQPEVWSMLEIHIAGSKTYKYFCRINKLIRKANGRLKKSAWNKFLEEIRKEVNKK